MQSNISMTINGRNSIIYNGDITSYPKWNDYRCACKKKIGLNHIKEICDECKTIVKYRTIFE